MNQFIMSEQKVTAASTRSAVKVSGETLTTMEGTKRKRKQTQNAKRDLGPQVTEVLDRQDDQVTSENEENDVDRSTPEAHEAAPDPPR